MLQVIKQFGPKLVLLTLLFIAVGSAVLDYFLPAMGDDLRFWNFLGLEDYHIPDGKTVKFIAAHVTGCNGRIFDYVGPILINLLPRWAAAAVMGGMTGLFFYSVLLLAKIPQKRNYTAFTLLLLAATLAVLPWWDAMWLRVCQFNYIWATTAAFLYLYWFFRQTTPGRPVVLALLLLLGICAGGMHEQIGLSLGGALFLWAITERRYRSLTKIRKWMLTGLAIGILFPLGSPALWSRAAAESIPDEPIHLMETTIPVYLTVLLIVACCAISKKGRGYLKRVFSAQFAILFVAAGFAGLIAIWSGIPGRTGWFVESAAMIILARLILKANFTTNKVMGTAAGGLALLFIVVHYTFSIQAQKIAYREYNEVKELYVQSPDGTIFYDFTPRYSFPALTLNRIKGVPDADDRWNRLMLWQAYRHDKLGLVIIPEAFAGRMPLAGDSLTIGSTTVYRRMPGNITICRDSLPVQHHQGKIRVVEAFPSGWLATELVLDPGDYH